MLAIKALQRDEHSHPADEQAGIDELREAEKEAASLREFGASSEVFAKIWDNPDDAEYDRL